MTPVSEVPRSLQMMSLTVWWGILIRHYGKRRVRVYSRVRSEVG